MNQNGIQNQLLWKYQQSQQNKVPFQNNSLLQQNPMFRDNMNYSNSQQMQMMQAMHAKKMQHFKELQQINQLEKLNELENMVDKEKIRESVIKPTKIDKKNNMDDIIKNAKEKWGFEIKKKKSVKNQYDAIDDQFQQNLENQKKVLQKERTNLPYKNIIKNIKDGDNHYEKHYKKFVDNPLIGEADKTQIEKAEQDLLVHKVTNADKEGVEEEFEEFEKNLETHNNELKVIYSSSKEAEHKKQFEYNHKSKYRIKYDPESHDDMKKDKINILKKEQKRMEKGKQTVDDVMQFLADNELLGEIDINNILNENDSGSSDKSLDKSSNIDDSKQDTNPQETKNVVKPSEVKQIVKPVVKQVIKPQEVKQVIKPQEVKQIIKPQEVKQAVKPQEVKQAVKSQEVKQVVKPQEVKQVVKPQEVKQAIKSQQVKPQEVKQVVKPQEIKQVVKPMVKPAVRQVVKPESTVQKGRVIRPEVKQTEDNKQTSKKHIINNKKHIEL